MESKLNESQQQVRALVSKMLREAGKDGIEESQLKATIETELGYMPKRYELGWMLPGSKKVNGRYYRKGLAPTDAQVKEKPTNKEQALELTGPLEVIVKRNGKQVFASTEATRVLIFLP